MVHLSSGPQRAKTNLPSELLAAARGAELVLCLGPKLNGSSPGPAELARELLGETEQLRGGDVETLHEWLARGRVEQTLEALERRLGPRFVRAVERAFSARDPAVPAMARAIAALAGQLRAVYSTAIDRTLERAFEDRWPSFAKAQVDLGRRREIIVKLCGTLEFPETWVLTRAAAEREFGPRALRHQLLASVARTHCMLFIGFAPGSELSERLFAIAAPADYGAQAPTHFVVLPSCSREQQTLLESRGLQLIEAEPRAVLARLANHQNEREDEEHGSRGAQLPACPYPGLSAFDESLAPVFHGRRAEISAAASRLGGPPRRHRRWLAIDGSSGVGKSSLVHAGIVPALRRGFAEGTPSRWWVARFRPGQRPLHALVESIATAIASHTRVDASQLFSSDDGREPAAAETLANFVRDYKPKNVALLVVVDQLEELVSLAEDTERELFCACVDALLREGTIYLITTLRSDFTAALSAHVPAFARLLNDEAQRYTLAPISRVGLRAAIAEPALQLGVSFEAELVERIASDAAHHLSRRSEDGGIVRTDDAALPLVAHVLRGLWDAGAADDGDLSFAEYEALGGVSGALSRSADNLMQGLGARQRTQARSLLLGLVNLDGGRLARRALPRAEACELAGGESEGGALLHALSGAAGPRIIVVRKADADTVVEIVHEALLWEWGALREWIAASRTQLARDDALTRRAAAWHEQGRPWRSLPRGRERRELLRGRARGEDRARQRAYQGAMRRAPWFRSGAWLAAGTTLALLAKLTVAELQAEADASQAQVAVAKRKAQYAEENEAKATKDAARADARVRIELLLNARECREALVQLVTSEFAFEGLLERAARCEAVVGRLDQLSGPAPVTSVERSLRDQELWVGYEDGHLTRWSPASGDASSAQLHHEAIDRIAFDRSGERVALGGPGNTILVDATAQQIGEPLRGADPVFAPDQRQLATRAGEALRVYDTSTGKLLWERRIPDLKSHTFAAKSGSWLVAAGDNRGSIISRLAPSDGASRGANIAVSGRIRDIALSPNEELVASVADDNRARIFSLADNRERASFVLGLINKSDAFIEFAPARELLMILRSNQRIAITDSELDPVFEREPIERSVRPRFSPDARWLLTAQLHGSSVELHSSLTGEELALLPSPDAPRALAFSDGGDRIAIGSANGEIAWWALDARSHWRAHPHQQGVYALAFAPNKLGALLSGSSDQHLHGWDLGGATWNQALDGWIIAIQVEPDGGRGLALSTTGALFDWSRDGGRVRAAGPWCTPKQGALSAAGTHLALLCQTGEAQAWELSAPAPRQISLLGADEKPSAIALAPEGRWLALGDSEGTIREWELTAAGATLVRTLPEVHGGRVRDLAYDASGAHLVSGGNDNRARLWSTDRSVVEDRELGDDAIAVALSADGRLAAAADRNTSHLIVWGLEQGTRELEVCERANVEVLAFGPDAEFIAAGCTDGSLDVWPSSARAQREFACQRLAATGELPSRSRCDQTKK